VLLSPLIAREACSRQAVAFGAGLTGGTEPISIAWDLGDGTVRSEAEFTHTYDRPGTYTVTLHASDAFGCADSWVSTVTVHETPLVSFRHSAPACHGEQVGFDGETVGGTGPFVYEWDFGDGETADTENRYHRYASPGSYTVRFRATSADGCSETAEDQVVVLPLPVPDPVSDAPACAGDPIRFAAPVTGGTGTTFVTWDFGDGAVGAGPEVVHSYGDAGLYEVLATARDVRGCSFTRALQVEVLDALLEAEPLGLRDNVLNGNANESADPGETLLLPLQVTNLGSDLAYAVEVRIVSVDGPAVPYVERDTIGNLPAGDGRTAQPLLQVAGDAPCGSEVRVAFEASMLGLRCVAPAELVFHVGAKSPGASGGEIRVTEEPTLSHGPALARGGGIYDLAWSDGRHEREGGDEEVTSQRLTDAGIPIPYPIRISHAAGASREPAMAWSPLVREFLLVWVDDTQGWDELHAQRLDANGLPLGSVYLLGIAPAREPDLTADEDGYQLVFRGADDTIRLARLNQLGRLEFTPALVSSGAGRRPAVAWSGASVGVVWEEGDDDSPTAAFRVFNEWGNPISDERIPGAAGSSREPDLAWDGDEFYLVWAQGAAGLEALRGARYDESGVRTAAPVALTAGEGARAPAAASDGANGVTIAYLSQGGVWVLGTGPQGTIGSASSVTAAEAVPSEPEIVWAGDIGEYLVAWTDARYPLAEILVRRVAAAASYVCDPVGPLPIPSLPEVLNLEAGRSGSSLRLSWDTLIGATGYRVYRGDLGFLNGLGYNHRIFPPSVGACDVAGPPFLGASDLETRGDYYYLVSALDWVGAEGSLGTADLDGDGVGDEERPLGPANCP
jgi:PKD repeat protein